MRDLAHDATFPRPPRAARDRGFVRRETRAVDRLFEIRFAGLKATNTLVASA